MDKTLIILGAGASKDFCRIFPTGLELIREINYHFLTEKKFPEVPDSEGVYLSALMNDISRTFQSDTKLFNRIKNSLWNIQLNYEWHSLRNNPINPVSIDNFIATKIKDGELDHSASDIIKYSIYYLIKGTEQALSEGHYNLTENWIKELAEKLSGYDINTIVQNLIVVTFNYDRIFEKYFINYLSDFLALNNNQAAFIQKNIIHVYGSLGNLSEIPFELKNEEVNIIKQKYDRIKLIDDRNTKLMFPNSDKYKKIHFIGFGYDETNLNIIDLNQFKSASFHGTAYYYTDNQIKKLRSKYNIDATNISCIDFIRSLTI